MADLKKITIEIWSDHDNADGIANAYAKDIFNHLAKRKHRFSTSVKVVAENMHQGRRFINEWGTDKHDSA